MKYLLSAMILVIFIGISAWNTSPVHGADATVTDCTNFAGAGTISDAITAANTGGGTITFACPGTITFSSTLTITDTVIINANGNVVVFDGGGTTSFFAVDTGASLTVDGFIFQNGSSATGGAINNTATLIVANSTFSNNNASNQGGAIYNTGSLTVTDSTFTSNDASNQGGAIYNTGTASVTNSEVNGNGALLSGGGIYNTGTLTIIGSQFNSNLAVFAGEAIENNGGTVSSQNSQYANNDCNGAITDNGGNTATSAAGCPNSPLNALSATAVCIGADLQVNILAGDAPFQVTSSSGTHATGLTLGTHIIPAFGNQTGVNVTELAGDTENFALGNINCSSSTLSATAVCIGADLQVNILAGDAPFQVTSSSGTHATGLTLGTHIIPAFGNQTGVNVTELAGDTENFPLGNINCSSSMLYATAECVGTDLHINILAGDPSYTVFADSGTLLITVIGGYYIIPGPAIWTNLIVRELMGDMQDLNLGDFDCTTPTVTPTVLGCALDTSDGLDIFNAPDNTYCRVLMKNGAVTDFSGAIPAQLIQQGVILAVDVYRLDGGMSINTFPDYARVCLAGQGRLFYLDGRTSPRVQVELATETVGTLTCGWIPAPGTLILTN